MLAMSVVKTTMTVTTERMIIHITKTLIKLITI